MMRGPREIMLHEVLSGVLPHWLGSPSLTSVPPVRGPPEGLDWQGDKRW